MPGMSGVMMANRIQETAEQLPFSLTKPFSVETLAAKVSEMTNGGSVL